MPTNKPEVMLPTVPQDFFDEFGVIDHKLWNAISPRSATRVDTLTRPAAGEFVEAQAEPRALRALVTAANAVLAENPADDGMWTLEQAVRPFNATKPDECVNGCPANQVCDYCQHAAMLSAAPQQSAKVGRVCNWHQQDEGYDTFSTGCGHEYTVNDCTDGNVQLPYCPFCAKPLRGIAWNESDDISLSEALTAAAPHQPAEAVAYRVVDANGVPCPVFGKWVEAGFWESGEAIKPVLREGFRYQYAYTTPPQAIDIGKLRGLVERWRESAADAKRYSTTPHEDGCAAEQRRCANELAALIGDGGEDGAS